MDQLPTGIYVCDRDGRLVRFNRRAAEVWGVDPDMASGKLYCGAVKAFNLDGTPLDLAAHPIAEALRTRQPVRDRRMIVERPDGSRLHVLANAEPLFDDDGGLIGAVNTLQDITELQRARDALSLREDWSRQMAESSPIAFYITDPEGRLVAFNKAAVALWGRTPTVGEDRWCGSHRLFHPDGAPMPLDQCPMAQALRDGVESQGSEAIFERPDGSRGAFLAYPMVLRNKRGAVVGAVNMLVDISERRQAEDRQRVLLDELNHRVKNTLASVQSLAAQSLRGRGDPVEMRRTFEDRLLALSRAHNQLAESHWERADLKAIVGEMLAPYRTQGVTLRGEATALDARVGVTMAMVLHELATNAAKYGALSTPDGKLDVSWGREGADLVLTWRETGGPAIDEERQDGFGSRFIKGAVERELGGRIEHAFEPSGVVCRITLRSSPAP